MRSEPSCEVEQRWLAHVHGQDMEAATVTAMMDDGNGTSSHDGIDTEQHEFHIVDSHKLYHRTRTFEKNKIPFFIYSSDNLTEWEK